MTTGTVLRRPELHVGERRHTVASVRVCEELDLLTVPQLRRELVAALDAVPEVLLVDLSGCRFTGADGVALLLSAHLRARGQGTRLVLCGCRPQALWVLRLCGLSQVLELVPAGRD